MTRLVGSVVAATFAFVALLVIDAAAPAGAAEVPQLAVGPQYDTFHVYVAPASLDAFVASLLATFGGSATKPAIVEVTPTPSRTLWQAVMTPAGTFSVFAFEFPIPYPFGAERPGLLVGDFDAALRAATDAAAAILVGAFADAIGRDAIIQWPGGVNAQLYWHMTPPTLPALATIPESRVYLPAERVAAFLESFLAFARGKIASDEAGAPGIEIGRPGESYRRIRVESGFGKLAVLVTDGRLPYPYGREIAGYEVADLETTLAKASAAGVAVLVPPYEAASRRAAMVQFPGGYIAEIHMPLDGP